MIFVLNERISKRGMNVILMNDTKALNGENCKSGNFESVHSYQVNKDDSIPDEKNSSDEFIYITLDRKLSGMSTENVHYDSKVDFQLAVSSESIRSIPNKADTILAIVSNTSDEIIIPDVTVSNSCDDGSFPSLKKYLKTSPNLPKPKSNCMEQIISIESSSTHTDLKQTIQSKTSSKGLVPQKEGDSDIDWEQEHLSSEEATVTQTNNNQTNNIISSPLKNLHVNEECITRMIGELPYQCKFCVKYFDSKSSFDNHLQNSTCTEKIISNRSFVVLKDLLNDKSENKSQAVRYVEGKSQTLDNVSGFSKYSNKTTLKIALSKEKSNSSTEDSDRCASPDAESNDYSQRENRKRKQPQRKTKTISNKRGYEDGSSDSSSKEDSGCSDWEQDQVNFNEKRLKLNSTSEKQNAISLSRNIVGTNQKQKSNQLANYNFSLNSMLCSNSQSICSSLNTLNSTRVRSNAGVSTTFLQTLITSSQPQTQFNNQVFIAGQQNVQSVAMAIVQAPTLYIAQSIPYQGNPVLPVPQFPSTQAVPVPNAPSPHVNSKKSNENYKVVRYLCKCPDCKKEFPSTNSFIEHKTESKCLKGKNYKESQIIIQTLSNEVKSLKSNSGIECSKELKNEKQAVQFIFQCLKCKKNYKSEESFKNHKLHSECKSDSNLSNRQHGLTKLSKSKLESSSLNTVNSFAKIAPKGNIPEKSEFHFISPVFQCPKCEKTFQARSKLEEHISRTLCGDFRRLHKFQCDVCGKRYKSERILRDHKNSHTNEKPYECASCDKRFGSKACLVIHISTMHLNAKKNFVCCFCGMTTPNFLHLQAHENVHRLPEGATIPTPFKCSECDKEFISKYSLQQHKRRHRSKKCKRCGITFSRNNALEEHVCRKSKKRECTVCGKSVYSLKTHMDIVHSTVLKFFCDVCEKGFKTKHLIEQHMITHSDERPISCPECDDTFKRQTHLKQHMAAFHGIGKRKKKIGRS